MGIIKQFIKNVTGIQALQDKHEARRLTEEADSTKEFVEAENQRLNNELNLKIQHYQNSQEIVLRDTMGTFRVLLKDLPFGGKKDNEYQQLGSLNLETVTFSLPNIEFKTKEVLKTIGMGVLFGVFAAGYVASKYRAEKLTEAVEYHERVMQYKAESERQWVLMQGICRRADEQEEMLLKLRERAVEQLDYLRPLVYEFMLDDEYYILALEKTRTFLKPISTICSTPLINDFGQLNGEWNKIQADTKLLLEKNL